MALPQWIRLNPTNWSNLPGPLPEDDRVTIRLSSGASTRTLYPIHLHRLLSEQQATLVVDNTRYSLLDIENELKEVAE